MEEVPLSKGRDNWGMIVLIGLCILLIGGVFLSLIFAFSAERSSNAITTEFAILEATHQALGTYAADLEENQELLGMYIKELQMLLDEEESARSTAEALSEQTMDSVEQQASTIRVNRLASDAITVFEESPPRGLLLAIEAVKSSIGSNETPSTNAVAALRELLSRSGGQSLVGHDQPVDDLALSLDGRWLLSVSRDGSIQLRDLTSEFLSSTVLNLSCLGYVQNFAKISPNTRWLATGGEHGSLCLWSLNQGSVDLEPIILQGHQSTLQSIKFNPSGNLLFSADTNGSIYIWDLMDPAAIQTSFEYFYPTTSLSDADISEDFTMILGTTYQDQNFLIDVKGVGQNPIPLDCPMDTAFIASISSVHSVAMIAENNKTCIIDLDNLNSPPIVSSEVDESIREIALSPDGNWLVTAGDNVAYLQRMQDLTLSPLIFEGHESPIIDLTFTFDSKYLITAGGDGRIYLLDLASSDPTQDARLVLGHDDPIYSIDISENGQWLVSGGYAGIIRLWDLEAPIGESWVITKNRSRALAISPDSHWLLTSHEAILQSWDLTHPTSPPVSYYGFTNSILSADFSSQSQVFAVGSWDETLHFWEPFDPAWSVIPTILEAENGITLVEVSPSGRWLLYNVGDRDITNIIDLQSQDRTPMPLMGLVSNTKSAAFSPEEKWLVVGSSHGDILGWDLTLEEPFSQPTSLGSVRLGADELIFSANGQYLIAQERDTLLLWDISTGSLSWEPHSLGGHVGHLTDVDLSPDHQWIAASSIHGPITLWNIRDLNAPEHTMNHRAVDRIAFSPDGDWLASAGQDHLVRLWNLRSENPSHSPIVLEGHEDLIYGLTFTPEGNWLISTSGDSVRAWNMSIEVMLSKACAAAGRNLTVEEWQNHLGEEPYRRTCDQYPPTTPISYEPTPIP